MNELSDKDQSRKIDTLNLRLVAVLERHPRLRPTDKGAGLYYDSTEEYWEWIDTTGPCDTPDDTDAHNAIFRTMVDGLPKAHGIRNSWITNDARWYVFDDSGSFVNRTFGETATDALLAFWMKQEPQK